MFNHTTQIRVRFYETDKMGFMHHSNYARYYECARTEAIRDIGYPYDQMEKEGFYMPVVKIESKFIKPVFYDDVVTIKTQIQNMPRFGMLTFYHEFYCKEELIHTGTITLASINATTQKRENGPEKLLALLTPYFK